MDRYRTSLLILLASSLLFALPGVARLNISEELLSSIEAQYNRFARQRVEGWRALVDDPADRKSVV